MTKELVRYAEYIRFSTGAQDEDRQLIELAELAEEFPGVLVERVIEAAKSGTLSAADRPGAQRVAALLRSGQVKELRLAAVDRPTRALTMPERFFLFELARETGCQILIAGGIRLDPSNPATADRDEDYWYGEARRGHLELKVTRGRTYKIKRLVLAAGGNHGVRPKYGYDWVREEPEPEVSSTHVTWTAGGKLKQGWWTVIEREAKVVRRIFEEAAAGRSCRGSSPG